MSNLLNEDQLLEIRQVFSIFDTGDGAVKVGDVGTIVRSLGHNPTEEDIENIVKELDPQGKGTVDFPHFLEFIAKKKKKDSPAIVKEELMEAFRSFDKDGAGRINAGLLKHIMSNLGEAMSADEVEEMIRLGDEGETGYVDYEKLVDLMLSL